MFFTILTLTSLACLGSFAMTSFLFLAGRRGRARVREDVRRLEHGRPTGNRLRRPRS